MTLAAWLPLVKLFPLSSLPSRLFLKLIQIKGNALIKILPDGRGYAARTAGDVMDSVQTLILNRKSPLGDKGFELHLPQDEIIYKEVERHGRWESDVVNFLARSLNTPAKVGEEKKNFLDIGANVGLTSLQVLRKVKGEAKAILVEPIPDHVDAINFNLRQLPPRIQFSTCQSALGTENANAKIFVEGSNHGNSSLIRGAVPIHDSSTIEIQTMDALDFAERYLRDNSRIILKCDTQGFDAKILARLPGQIWDRVDAAVIEIWALPEIALADVEKCIDRFRNFSFVSWAGRSNDKVALAEVARFWLMKDSDSRNLFLRR